METYSRKFEGGQNNIRRLYFAKTTTRKSRGSNFLPHNGTGNKQRVYISKWSDDSQVSRTNDKVQRVTGINFSEIESILKYSEGDFIELEIDNKTRIMDCISRYCNRNQVQIKDIFSEINILKQMVKYLKKYNQIRYSEIMEVMEIPQNVMLKLQGESDTREFIWWAEKWKNFNFLKKLTITLKIWYNFSVEVKAWKVMKK